MKLPEPGKSVSVKTKDGLTINGLVLPSDHLVLKLDNGYNLGVDNDNIEEIA